MPAHEAWGLDIGQSGLHAVKIARQKGGGAQVTDVFFIKFEAGLEDEAYDECVNAALTRLMTEKNVGKMPIVASLPGFSTLFREFELPAVSDSKLSEIVSYEAKQKIPYPLEDVIWDYHKMRVDEDTGELGMALLCCRKDIVAALLAQLDSVGFTVEAIQVGPVALMNYVMFDQQPEEPMLILDTGSRSTDFIVINGDTFWLRSIGVSGADLSKALMAKFSIVQGKADELKFEVGQSRQGERVFRILEPVLRNLCNEVQRSIGFYKSLYRGARISEIVCAGNTFLLSGIDQFVADNVGLPTRTLDAPMRIPVQLADHAAEVTESRQVFGTAAGLALQGIGLAPIEMTLLPPERRQLKMIQEKLPFGFAAVAIIALTVAISFLMAGDRSGSVKDVMGDAKKAKTSADKRLGEYAKKLKLFGPEKEKSKHLANLPARRGDLMVADTAVMALIETLNEARLERVKPADKRTLIIRKRVEGDALRASATKSFPPPKAAEGVPEEDQQKVLDDWQKDIEAQVAQVMEWRYSRYGRIFITENTYTFTTVVLKKNPSKAKNVPRKIVDEKKTLALRARRNTNDENTRRRPKKGKPARKVVPRDVVVVNLQGFIVNGGAADIATLRKALLAMTGQRTGNLNMNPKTQVSNAIRIPKVSEPLIAKGSQTGVADLLPSSGAGGASAAENSVSFVSTTEKGCRGFDVTFYFDPEAKTVVAPPK